MVSRYHTLPEKLRMVLTATLGALTGLVTYEIVYLINPFEPRATTAWSASFLVGIARQHGLHRALTFAHHSPYWPSLGRAYVMYTGALVVGTVLNWVLTRKLGVGHHQAWLCCLLSTSTISLIFLKQFVFSPRK